MGVSDSKDADGANRRPPVTVGRWGPSSPLTKAGGYYARSLGIPGRRRGELPVARPTPVPGHARALRDEIVLVGLRWKRPLSSPAVYERINGEVAQTVELYRRAGLAGETAGFFTAPPAPTDVVS